MNTISLRRQDDFCERIAAGQTPLIPPLHPLIGAARHGPVTLTRCQYPATPHAYPLCHCERSVAISMRLNTRRRTAVANRNAPPEPMARISAHPASIAEPSAKNTETEPNPVTPPSRRRRAGCRLAYRRSLMHYPLRNAIRAKRPLRFGRNFRSRNSSNCALCNTVRLPPLASSSTSVDGTASQSKPRRPNASRCSHTIIRSFSMAHPFGVSPSCPAIADGRSSPLKRSLIRSYRLLA